MLRKPPRSPKSLPDYSGPFTVIRHNRGGAYLLQDSTGVTLSDKFSPNQLKLVAPPEDSTNELPPDEYEIDEILDHKGPANKREYFVHWKGYPHSDNQWIPAKDVHAPKLIKQGEYVGKITNTYLKTPHVGSVPDPQLFFLLYPPILPFSSFPFLQASPATSATPASSSAPTTCNPTSTLPQQTHVQPPARQSFPSSHSLNSMSSMLQQSSTPAPAAEQQDSIKGEEEYDEFFESQ
ncbi:hypothetical protein QOT17_021948 [Balamuthia mandrillaris]